MTTSDWVRRYHPGAGGVRLVCFPHAGGSASSFYSLSAALAPAVEVLAVQYPGRQDRRAEPTVTDLGRLADLAHAALLPYAEVPLAFFGHSMGAIVGFEVARRLQRGGAPAPTVLFASGRRAPSAYRTETMMHRSDPATVLAELKRLGGPGTSLLADPELLEIVLPAIHGDYQAIETYRPQGDARISSAVVAIVGDQDPRVTLPEADAWRGHTTGTFERHVIRGAGHFFLGDHEAQVARIVADRLAVSAEV